MRRRPEIANLHYSVVSVARPLREVLAHTPPGSAQIECFRFALYCGELSAAAFFVVAVVSL